MRQYITVGDSSSTRGALMRWNVKSVAGVYFVVVNAKGADGIEYEIKRDVNLLRGYFEEGGDN